MKNFFALSFLLTLWAGAFALMSCSPAAGGGSGTDETDSLISIPELSKPNADNPIIGTWTRTSGTTGIESMTFDANGTFTSTGTTGDTDIASYSVKDNILMRLVTPPGTSESIPIMLINDKMVVPPFDGGSIPPGNTPPTIPRVSGSGFSGVWKGEINNQSYTVTLSESSYKIKAVDSTTAQVSLTSIAVFQGRLEGAPPDLPPELPSVQARNFTVSKAAGYQETYYTISGDTLTLAPPGSAAETYTRVSTSGSAEAQQ